MADRFFQGYIYQLQKSIYRTFGVIDNKEIVSCSNQEMIGITNSFNLMKQKKTRKADAFLLKIIHIVSSMRIVLFDLQFLLKGPIRRQRIMQPYYPSVLLA